MRKKVEFKKREGNTFFYLVLIGGIVA